MTFLHIKPEELELTKKILAALECTIVSVSELREDGTHLVTVLKTSKVSE